MKTRVSTKGQVVLPLPIRHRLGLRAGDCLEARIENGSVVLTPQNKSTLRPRITTDPLTGLPALTAGPGAPRLSNEEVEEILSRFP